MNIAVVTAQTAAGEQGGAERLYDGLVGAFDSLGHHVSRLDVRCDESTFDGILDAYAASYDLDLGDYDLVISTKAPTFMVRHRNHVSYLLHTIRVFYDMFEREYGAGTTEQRSQRSRIHALDRYALDPQRIRRHFANGHETFERLRAFDPSWQSVSFTALHHPSSLEEYREPRVGKHILLPGRLHRWKRPDLVIKAFRHLDRDVKLLVCGTGEDEGDFRNDAGDDKRVEFLGRVDEDQLVELYADAIAVPFVPLREDYGLVPIEAYMSGKPVVTCFDSGEPLHFVKNFQTGLVADPTPSSIAEKLTYLIDHSDEARAMGLRGRERMKVINWEAIVDQLLGPTPELEQPRKRRATNHREALPVLDRVTVLDMQPIEPAVGGGRLRLLGLYHDLGLPTTYIGTYDWPGPGFRQHFVSDSLEEISVPLSEKHFAAARAWQERIGSGVVDVSFPLLGNLSTEFMGRVATEAADAKCVVFSHPWLYPLVRDALRREKQLIVYDAHNVEGYLRTLLLDDGGAGTELAEHAVRIEYQLCSEAHLILTCSREDTLLFHELYDIPFAKMRTAPNGAFTRVRRQVSEGSGVAAALRRPVAVFVGSGYGPNLDAATFIRDELAPAFSAVTFLIVGGVGTEFESRFANVRVTGVVSPEEKDTYLATADIALNPMFSGSGTNVKMLEFMAAGLPIVTTPVGARGIHRASEIFEVRGRQGFPAGLRRLLRDKRRATMLAREARIVAEDRYSWERISSDLGNLLRHEYAQLRRPRPFFSIVVATYERPEALGRLVELLQEQSFENFEVIIVDQSASAWVGSRDCLDLLYLRTDVKSPAHARNVGAAYARGSVLAFTDDDCEPRPNWLEQARAYFDVPGVVGVEGLIVSDRDYKDQDYRPVSNVGFEQLGFKTANLLADRETFLAIGGFDERFDRPFREDTDLGWRLLDRGTIPFAHDAIVYHPAHSRETERESWVERARLFEKDALLLSKHPERYRELFLFEAHYQNDPLFREHFLRGAEIHGVAVDDFYLSLLDQAAGVETVAGRSLAVESTA